MNNTVKNFGIAWILLSSLTCLAGEKNGRKQFIVTTTDNSGPGSLRHAISCANAYNKPSTIVFELPVCDSRYNECSNSWSIKLEDELPAICAPVKINGYTQHGAVKNSNEIDQENNADIAIEISGPGIQDCESSDLKNLFRGLTFREGSQGASVHGLAINDCPVGIEVSADAIKIRGNFIGTALDGFTSKANLISVLITDIATGTHIGGLKPAHRNLIAGLGKSASEEESTSSAQALGAVTNFGAGTRIENATVNLTRSGNEAVTRAPGVGIISVGNAGTTIGGADKVQRVVIANYELANLLFDATQGDTVQQVYAGTNAAGTRSLGGGDGIVFTNSQGSEGLNRAADEQCLHLVKDCVCSGHDGSGVVIGQEGDYFPVEGVHLINTFSGTDSAGEKRVPNSGNGLILGNAVGTSILGCKFNFNHTHGIYAPSCRVTEIVDSDINYNMHDGINYLCQGNATADSANTSLGILFGGQSQACSCSVVGPCLCYSVDKWGSKICC